MQCANRWGTCLLALWLGLPVVLFAQEAPPDGPPEGRRPDGRRPGEGRRMDGRRWRMDDDAQPGREENPFTDLGELNAVDKAFYEVAQLLYEKGEYENAIRELGKVAAESPDERAKAGAHLVAAHIYRFKLQQIQKAIDEYKQVTGDLSRRAMKAMVLCYESLGRSEDATAVLEEKLKQCAEAEQKVQILNEIAQVHRRSGSIDKAIETLRRIPEMVTYEQAEAMRKEQGMAAPWGDALGRIQGRIDDLRARGRFAEAERMEQYIRQMQERMRAMRGKGNDDAPRKEGPQE